MRGDAALAAPPPAHAHRAGRRPAARRPAHLLGGNLHAAAPCAAAEQRQRPAARGGASKGRPARQQSGRQDYCHGHHGSGIAA